MRYFPHYQRDEAARLQPGTIPAPEAITQVAVDLLKVWPTWHRLYEAAFGHDLADRLPRVGAPALVLQTLGDPLARYAIQAAEWLTAYRTEATLREDRVGVIAAFLDDVLPLAPST